MHNFIYFFTYINVNATHSNHFAWWISDSQRAQHKWLLSTYNKCIEDNLMGSLTKKKKERKIHRLYLVNIFIPLEPLDSY